MTAVITLLSSIFIAVFLIGPAITARFLIELLIIKQPSRTQSSTEELARSLFGSIPALVLATLLVSLFYGTRYTQLPGALIRVFDGNTRSAAIHELWPIRTVLYFTYAEVLSYVLLIRYAVSRIPHLQKTEDFWTPYGLFSRLTSPYLKSEWDVLASGILLPPGVEIYADVATRSRIIYMGKLEGAKTASDGSLVHLQLSNPVIRSDEHAASTAAATQDPLYVFGNSMYFVIPAGEIANVNLRFAQRSLRASGTEAAPLPISPEAPQPLPEFSLDEAVQELDEHRKKTLRAELDGAVNVSGDDSGTFKP